MRKFASRVVIVLLAGGLGLCGQSWDALGSLKAGERVVVQERGGREHSGAFRSVSADAISVDTGKGEVAIERTKVRTVKIRAGGHRLRNFLIGAAIGVAVGATVDNTLGRYFRNETGESAGARAVTYVAPVAIFGGIGAALPGYRTIYRAP